MVHIGSTTSGLSGGDAPAPPDSAARRSRRSRQDRSRPCPIGPLAAMRGRSGEVAKSPTVACLPNNYSADLPSSPLP